MLLFCPVSPDNWVWIRQITMSILRPYTYKHVLVINVPAGNPGHNWSSVRWAGLASPSLNKLGRFFEGDLQNAPCHMIKTHPCSKTISAEHCPRCCSPSPAIVTSLYEYKFFKWDAKRCIINQSINCYKHLIDTLTAQDVLHLFGAPPPVVECGQCCHSEFAKNGAYQFSILSNALQNTQKLFMTLLCWS